MGESGNVVGIFGQVQSQILQDPLAFLRAEHARQVVVHRALMQVAETLPARPSSNVVWPIIKYLTMDLPRHFADEEKSLFPLLTARSLIADPIEGWTGQLNQEHSRDGAMARIISHELERIVADGAPEKPSGFAALVTVFAECQDRHLAWENIVILTHAEIRLGDEDLRKLGREMAMRRGMSVSE